MNPRTLIIAFFLSSFVFAQKYNFIKYDVKQGLSLSQISDIDSYSNASLLISTYGGGINIYNGKEFKQITTIDGLANSTVYSTLIQNDNLVWVGTEKGLSRISKSGIRNFNRNDGLPSENIWALELGANGAIWIGTENGLAKYENGKFEVVEDELVSNKTIWYIVSDLKGNLWISTTNSVVFFDSKRNKFSKPEKYQKFGTVYTMAETEKDVFWFGTKNGLYKFDGEDLSNFTTTDGLTHNVIWKIFRDSRNNLWFGTDEGATLYRDGKFEKLCAKEGLTDYKVWTIYEDVEKTVWFGTDAGLYKLTDFAFKIYNDINGKPIDAWTIIEKNKDEYWIGSELEGVLRFRNGKFSKVDIGNFKIRGLSSLFIDRDNNVWVTSDKGIYRYSHENYKTPTAQFIDINSVTTHILQDEKGNVKFGTLADGTIEFDGNSFNSITVSETERETVFYHLIDSKKRLWAGTSYGLQLLENDSIYVPEGFEELTNLSILNILEDNSGYIWAGSYESGLICFNSEDIRNPIFDTISVKHGLSNEAIMATTFDNDNNLWISTNSGINRIDINEYHKTAEKQVLSFGTGDGFLGSEGYQNGILTSSKGEIFISTLDGIIMFDPNEISKNKYSPIIEITGLNLIDSEFKQKFITQTELEFLEGADLEVAHDNKTITIEFVGLSLANPSKVMYSYRLDDGDWTEPTSNSNVYLSTLDHGKHSFEVKAFNNNGVVSKNIASLKFEIIAPIWLKMWFQILSVIVFVGLIFLFYLYRLNRMDKINKELEDRIQEKIRYESQLKKSEQQLRNAKEAAEKSDQLKTEFLAQMSHEIRTPINTILSYTNLLKEDVMEKVDESLREGFSTIDHSSHRLIRTIDSILNMSQLQTGNFELAKKKLNICKILKELHVELENLANQKNLKLELILKNEECRVFADQYTITQLIANLIDNAIKYTNKGKVQIILESSNNDKTNVKICDTGIGMSKEFQAKIFEPFSQEEQGYSRKYDGTGLGLALVKKYADLNNIKLYFDSQKGKGTTFTLEFAD